MARFILSAFADEASPSLDEQLQALKEEGIGLIELRGVDGKNCSKLNNYIKHIKEVLADSFKGYKLLCQYQMSCTADRKPFSYTFHNTIYECF